MRAVVAALEVVGVLLVAASAGVGLGESVGLWAGLLGAGVVVLGAAWIAERPTGGGDRGASLEPSEARR